MKTATVKPAAADAGTSLTVIERASIALGAAEHEKRLVELAKESTEITVITNPDGYAQCHAARMVLKNERVSLERSGKAARDDATKLSKAVIAEESRLIAIIEPEEKRLQEIQATWDRIEEEKREAEARRIDELQNRVEAISDIPMQVAGKPSADIAAKLAELQALDVSTFKEFAEFALEARNKATAALTQLHAGAVAQEQAAAAEAKKREEEQAELARLRAAEEQRKQQDAARVAEENRKLQEEMAASREAERIRVAAQVKEEAEAKARIRAEEDAARYRIEEQEREARRVRDAEDARAAEERARLDAEDRQRREAAEAESRKRAEEQAAEDARLKAEQERIEAEKREVARQAQELMDGRALLQTFVDRFSRRREFSGLARAIKEFLVATKPQQKAA